VLFGNSLLKKAGLLNFVPTFAQFLYYYFYLNFHNFSIFSQVLNFSIILFLNFVRTLFQALCKDLERGEVKKWLKQILEILMAERGKEERTEQVQLFFSCKVFLNYHPIPRQDSILQPIAPVPLVAGGDDTTRPCRQGKQV
jgi:hypothetical protein